jgi:hypothetical protein
MSENERETNDSGADQPTPTEEENEQAVTGRQQEEEAMRAPEHDNPDLAREEQIHDE